MEKVKKSGKNSHPPKASVFSLLKPYSGLVTFLIILALLGTAVNLVIPKLIARSIDAFTQNRIDLMLVITEFLIASVAIFVFTYAQGVVQTYASEKVAKDLRTQLSDKISKQSYSFILKSNPSKLLTNLTSDIDAIKMFVAQAFVIIVSSLFMIVGTCVLLISINWKLALLVMLIIPVIGGSFFIVLRKVRVLFKRSREIVDRLNKTINESITGAALIRVLNSQQPEAIKFLESNTDARDVGMSILKLFSVLIPIVMFTANLAIIIILAVGGHYVIVGNMSMGNLAAFNSYVFMLIFPILMIGFMSTIIAQASASYVRVDEVLKANPAAETGQVNRPIAGNILMQNIELYYADKPVLKDVNLEIKAGSRVAIIGPTAAGKSQLLYLLTGLIPPSGGKIKFDGIDIEDFIQEVFHKHIGFVFQDSVIFNISLRENIAFNDNVTEESLQKAIATAELTDYINSLPEKLDTIIAERGTSLSGGQKQRIMLARALAINPKILLLDDFTARVDRKTESKILCNLAANYPDLTLISVTQKIAPVKDFEQIILLMEGEVVATGTHNEMKETSPEYMQIYNSQRSTHHYEL